MKEKPSPIRPTDANAIALARHLLRVARFGALATLDPGDGLPQVTRVAVATDHDAAPLLLISNLAAHTRALADNPACALLLGEPGKGDPLAHPRLSVKATAQRVDEADVTKLRRRYLARHPKAALYVEFADFAFYRLEPVSALLNAGFGKAYELTRDDLLLSVPEGFAEMECHLRAEIGHEELLAILPDHSRSTGDRWHIGTIDPEGIVLVSGDKVERMTFPTPVPIATDLPQMIATLCKRADRT